jgi:hypothetical protein
MELNELDNAQLHHTRSLRQVHSEMHLAARHLPLDNTFVPRKQNKKG